MFDNARKAGLPEIWYAVPDGWDAGPGFDRVAEGYDASLAMLREVRDFLPDLPHHEDSVPVLVVYWHHDLTRHPKYKHAMNQALEQVYVNGRVVGVTNDPLMRGDARTADREPATVTA